MINESNGTFENCLFNNCSVVTDVTKNVPRGGSIYMIQSSYKFNISNFTSNFVRSEGSDSYVSGGAIDVLYSDVIIEKCFFIHNSVRSKNHLAYGGSLYIYFSNVTFISVNFIDNSIFSNYRYSMSTGGAIYAENMSCIFTDCNFTSNYIIGPNINYGGAGYFEKSNFAFNSCNFKNNSNDFASSTKGGSLYLKDSISNFSNSYFVNNYLLTSSDVSSNAGPATYSSGLYTSYLNCEFFNNSILTSTCTSESIGGAVYCRNQASFIQCRFQENKAFTQYTGRGGAVFISTSHPVDFNNCIFVDNIAKINSKGWCSGGSVYFYGKANCSFNSCEFINNSVISQGYEANGGSIYLTGGFIYLNSCKFKKSKIEAISSSEIQGGAVCLLNSNAYIYLCSFIDCNVSSNSSNTFGGAIYLKNSALNLEYCDFINNFIESIESSCSGAAIYLMKTTFNCNTCNFTYNNAQSIHGDGNSTALFLYNVNCTLNNCTFSRNKADFYLGSNKCIGGTINILASNDVLFNNCTFFSNNNAVRILNYGSCVYCNQSTFSFQNCTFERNYGQVVSGKVYGIFSVEYSNFTINDCYFYNNIIEKNIIDSSTFGNSIYVFNSNSQIISCLFISGLVYTNDCCSSEGGAICFHDSICYLFNCSFVANRISSTNQNSYIIGGAILFKTSKFSLLDCIFRDNTAYSKGGAVFIYQSNGTFSECVFDSNHASSPNGSGGAIFLSYGTCLIEKCNFTNNKAYEGDDIFYQNENSVDISLKINECKFVKENKNGSFIYLDWMSNSITPIIFSNNRVIIGNDSNAVVFDGLMKNNSIVFWLFERNCIFPYENKYFSSEKLVLLNSIDNSVVKFETAFDKYCVFQSSSFIFISHPFTKSELFSKSEMFSETSFFSYSNKFSQSVVFSKSLSFSTSFIFSPSDTFSRSDFFSQSFIFSNTEKFSLSMQLIDKHPFSMSDYVTTDDKYSEIVQTFQNSEYESSSDDLSQTESTTYSLDNSIEKESDIEIDTTSVSYLYDETETNTDSSDEIDTTSVSNAEYSDTTSISGKTSTENTNEFFFTSKESLLLFLTPNQTPGPAKNKTSKAPIIWIIIAIVVVVILLSVITAVIIIRKRKKSQEKSVIENTSRNPSTLETKQTKTSADISSNLDNDETDLDFWL